MKKFFGVLCVLLILAFPALAQEAGSKTLNFSVTIQGGALLEFSDYDIVWDILTPPLGGGVDEWVPAELVICNVSWRFAKNSKAQIICRPAQDLTNGESILPVQQFLRQTWTSTSKIGFVERPFPPALTDDILYDSVDVLQEFPERGGAVVEVLFEFFNYDELVSQIGSPYTTYVVYTIVELPADS